MHELIPLTFGVLVGLVAIRFAAGWSRWAALIAGSVLAGVFATFVTGERELWWGFVPIDVLQALLAAVAAGTALRVWMMRTIRSR